MAKSTKAKNVFDVQSIIPEKKTKTQSTQHTHDTQGTQRKQKHPRINMAFYGNNLEYVREASYQSRLSVTEYVNKLIDEDRQRKLHPESELAPGQLNIDDIE